MELFQTNAMLGYKELAYILKLEETDLGYN